MSADIIIFVVAGLHLPDICHTPGGDDLQVGCERVDGELETDLVVSFACSAVADRGSPFLAGDLDKLLGDGRPCHGGAQKVLVFVDGSGLHAGHDEIITELIDDVLDI